MQSAIAFALFLALVPFACYGLQCLCNEGDVEDGIQSKCIYEVPATASRNASRMGHCTIDVAKCARDPQCRKTMGSTLPVQFCYRGGPKLKNKFHFGCLRASVNAKFFYTDAKNCTEAASDQLYYTCATDNCNSETYQQRCAHRLEMPPTRQ